MSQGFKGQREIPLCPGEHFKVPSSGKHGCLSFRSPQESLDLNSYCPITFVERILDFQNLHCSLSSSLAPFSFSLLILFDHAPLGTPSQSKGAKMLLEWKSYHNAPLAMPSLDMRGLCTWCRDAE